MKHDGKARAYPAGAWLLRLPRIGVFGIGFGLLVVLLLSGCEAVTPEEEILNYQTILALTPSPTPTPPPTDTPTPTPSPTVPPTLTPTPTNTPIPTPTPLPPTPTPNPALQAFSLCNQVAGQGEQGRFSARATSVITTERFPAFERVLLDLDLAPDSAPPSAEAMLLNERDFTHMTGEPVAPAPYVLLVNLPHWLQDTLFTTSALTETYTLTNTDVLRNVVLTHEAGADAGATLVIGLEEPVSYLVSFSRDNRQLRAEVARPSALYIPPDSLATPAGVGDTDVPGPLFLLNEGDIWKLDSTGVVSVTDSPEEETALAVNQSGDMLAFCRAQEPGFSPLESSAPVPGSLWLVDTDGSNARRISDAGVNCAEPSFSPDGSMIAFRVGETGATPAQHNIAILPVESSATLSGTVVVTGTTPPDAASSQYVIAGDGWNRSGVRWLNDTTLVYAASSPDGRATLFLFDLTSGEEHDIGADILVANQQYRYRATGQPLVSPDGRMIAVEAMRADEAGADLLLLDAQGEEQDRLDQGYWTRPLAWAEDGSLYYMVTACESSVAQSYELYQRTSQGRDTLLATGVSFGTVGEAVATGDGLVYTVASRALPGPRGPNTASPYSPSDIWYWDLDRGVRAKLFASPQGILALKR